MSFFPKMSEAIPNFDIRCSGGFDVQTSQTGINPAPAYQAHPKK
jgi:hypothetical protein